MAFQDSFGVAGSMTNTRVNTSTQVHTRDPFMPYASTSDARQRAQSVPPRNRSAPPTDSMGRLPWRDPGVVTEGGKSAFGKRRRFTVALNHHPLETKVSRGAPFAPRKFDNIGAWETAAVGYPKMDSKGKVKLLPEYDSLNDPHLIDYYARKFGLIMPQATLGGRMVVLPDGRVERRKSAAESKKKKKLQKGEIIYKVSIKTADRKNAGTDARVFLRMKGSKGKMTKKQLKKKYADGEERHFKFLRGSTSVFKLRGPELGEIEKITIEHDGLENKHSWFVDDVEITNTATKRTWIFPCNRWLSLFEGDCQLSRDLKPAEHSQVGGKTSYEIVVVTGDVRGAGTDANVSIIIYGARGNTSKMVLTDIKPVFERGNTDIFKVRGSKVGIIKKVRIEHDNTGFAAGWFLDRIVITDESAPAKKYYFPCGQWLSKSDGDGLICRDLIGSTDLGAVRKANKYVVTVQTADRRGAGTDANVFMTLFGDTGDSGERRLNNSSNNFERGKKDEFTIEGPSLGAINRIRIGHDNRGVSAGWFLDKVIVDDITVGRVYEFPCGQWFAKDEGDGRIQRDLVLGGKAGGPPMGIPYKITAITGDVMNAATSARVFVILYGDVKKKIEGKVGTVEENSGKLYLESGKFERGRTDIFNLDVVGKLSPCTRITVGHDNSGAGPGWFCDKIIVFCPSTGIEQYFIADKWFATSEGDGLIERDLFERISMRKTMRAKNIWYATIYTSDKRMAGTNANVYMCIYGDKGHTDDIGLNNRSDNFESKSVDNFKVEGDDVGRPYKVRIWHDNGGTYAGWHLDKVELQNMTDNEKYFFKCNRWLSHDEEEGSIVREMPAEGPTIKKPLQLIKYQVEVYTGNKFGAGTDAHCFVNIFGEQGDTGPRELRKSSEHLNKHEKGATDIYTIEAVNLKKINKVRVWHDGKWAGAGWFLDKIIVQEGFDAKTRIEFPCHRWLDKDEDDGQIVRELVPEGESLLLATTTYYISVKTGDVTRAGTDAHVSIKVFGEDGDTGMLHLESSENKIGNKFERGRIDTFKMEATDIGQIEKIRIGHDGSNPGSGWYLDKAEIDVPSRGELYVFSTHRWLDTSEDDGLIEIEVLPTEVKQRRARIPYEITMKTGDKLGSGTDADVFIQIYGREYKTEIFTLRNRTDNFEQNSTDKFKIEAIDVGNIHKIRVGHNDKGMSCGWFLEKVQILRTPPKRKKAKLHEQCTEDERNEKLEKLHYTFACERWFDTKEDDGEIVRELVPTGADGRPLQRNPYNEYTVKVITGDVSHSGTDADVYVCIYGDHGDTGERKLWRSDSHINRFERGHDDIFRIDAADLGLLTGIRPRNSGSGVGSAWFLDSIEVTEKNTNTTTYFPCQRWLATDEDDGQLMRHLVPVEKALIDYAKGLAPKSPYNLKNNLGLELKTQVNTYYVHVSTGNSSMAGTDANVYVIIYGEKDNSGKCFLKSTRNHKNKFEKAQTDIFVVESAGLGELKKIKVGHDNSGVGPGWFLETVVIDCPSLGTKTVFPCGRWLATDQDDAQIERELFPVESQNIQYEKQVPYEIATYTADSMGAGTDADVFVAVFGKENATQETSLAPRKGDRKDLFNRNSVDTFVLEMDDVGDNIEKFRIGHSDTSMGAGWKLNKVVVRKLKHSKQGKPSFSEVYTFPCNRWLAKDEDDRAVVRELVPGEVIERSVDKFGKISEKPIHRQLMENRKYKIHIFTGDKFGAGSDANVFLTIFGENGDSGERKLVKSEKHMNKFERNQEDIFTQEAVDLGKLYKIKIRHDNSSLSPSWYLDRVVIVDGDNESYIFHCERWLAKNKDDGRIERSLYIKGHEGDTSSIGRSTIGSIRSLKSARDLMSRDSPRIKAPVFEGPTIPYTIKISTGDIHDADTNANAFVNIFGTEERKTGKLPLELQGKKPKFARGSIETFSIEAPDVGEIKSIEIGHDGVMTSQGWYIVEIEIDMPTAGKNYVFPCKRWFSVNQEDGLIARTLSVTDAQLKAYKALVAYEMTVRTGDVDNAGTDCNITVQIFGVNGSTQPITLEKGEDRFERSKVDIIKLELEDIAPLRKMRVIMDTKGSRLEWFLESISLRSTDTGEMTMFHCSEWFSKKGKSLMKELPASVRGKQIVGKTSYKISVKTSDLMGAGTDANVSMILFGENGESNVLELKDSLTHRNKFERNNTDEFSFKDILSLGELMKVRVWHDNHGLGASWHLNSMEVMDEGLNKPYKFHCDKWLSKTHEDKQITRELTCEGRALGTEQAVVVYEIMVQTGDKKDASTSHNAFIILDGELRKSKEFLLENSSIKKVLKRGQADEFKFQCENVGRIQGIYLGHLEREDGPAVKQPTGREGMWHCYDVVVGNNATGEKSTILVNSWLPLTRSRKEARYYDVTKVQEGRTQAVRSLAAVKYRIVVYTGTESGAGTDAKVYITLYGIYGDSGKHRLNKRTKNLFESGDVDDFVLEFVDLGDLQKVRIEHDNSGLGSAWFLDKVEVTNLSTNHTWKFPCSKWFDKKKGDKQICRDLLPIA